MDDDRCAVGVGWCARADAMLGAEGLHVIDVHRGDHGLEITVETDPEPVGCPSCGVIAAGHGRRVVRAADAPCFGLSVRVVWRKRVWRCPEPACAARTWSEIHPLIAPRAALTNRAVAWATDALAHDDTTVSALARHLRVDWHAGPDPHRELGGQGRGHPHPPADRDRPAARSVIGPVAAACTSTRCAPFLHVRKDLVW